MLRNKQVSSIHGPDTMLTFSDLGKLLFFIKEEPVKNAIFRHSSPYAILKESRKGYSFRISDAADSLEKAASDRGFSQAARLKMGAASKILRHLAGLGNEESYGLNSIPWPDRRVWNPADYHKKFTAEGLAGLCSGMIDFHEAGLIFETDGHPYNSRLPPVQIMRNLEARVIPENLSDDDTLRIAAAPYYLLSYGELPRELARSIYPGTEGQAKAFLGLLVKEYSGRHSLGRHSPGMESRPLASLSQLVTPLEAAALSGNVLTGDAIRLLMASSGKARTKIGGMGYAHEYGWCVSEVLEAIAEAEKDVSGRQGSAYRRKILDAGYNIARATKYAGEAEEYFQSRIGSLTRG